MKTVLIQGASSINKAIDSIARRGKKLDEDILVAGLSCLNHVEEHGDVTLFCRLYNAMPKGARRLALAEWGLAHGKIGANTDSATKAELPFVYDKTRTTDLESAEAQPWWEFRKEAEVSTVYDFRADLMRILGKARAAQQKGKSLEGAEDFEKLASMFPEEVACDA